MASLDLAEVIKSNLVRTILEQAPNRDLTPRDDETYYTATIRHSYAPMKRKHIDDVFKALVAAGAQIKACDEEDRPFLENESIDKNHPGIKILFASGCGEQEWHCWDMAFTSVLHLIETGADFNDLSRRPDASVRGFGVLIAEEYSDTCKRVFDLFAERGAEMRTQRETFDGHPYVQLSLQAWVKNGTNKL